MIIDVLGNAHLYEPMHPLFKAAFDYIRNTDLAAAPCGKTELMGTQLIAIIQTYDTMPAEQEQMEWAVGIVVIVMLLGAIGWGLNEMAELCAKTRCGR